MLPVLLSLGPLTISSFGFFLSMAFLVATFLAWRLSRAWDLSEEKILDLCLLSFFGSLLGARMVNVLEHLPNFADNLFKVFLLTKYPGLSFWGGLLGGSLTLYFFTKRVRKLDFWQVADLASVGLLGGLVFGNIGCLLGGCHIGIRSDFLGVDMIGFVGKRFPTQGLEAIIFSFILWKIWPLSIRFHFPGKIACLSLMTLGLVEALLGFLREENLWGFISAGLTFGIGLVLFYKLSKKDIREDLRQAGKFLAGLLTDERIRDKFKKRVAKSWYSERVTIRWSAYQIKKKLRRVRVKSTPEHF